MRTIIYFYFLFNFTLLNCTYCQSQYFVFSDIAESIANNILITGDDQVILFLETNLSTDTRSNFIEIYDDNLNLSNRFYYAEDLLGVTIVSTELDEQNNQIYIAGIYSNNELDSNFLYIATLSLDDMSIDDKLIYNSNDISSKITEINTCLSDQNEFVVQTGPWLSNSPNTFNWYKFDPYLLELDHFQLNTSDQEELVYPLNINYSHSDSSYLSLQLFGGKLNTDFTEFTYSGIISELSISSNTNAIPWANDTYVVSNSDDLSYTYELAVVKNDFSVEDIRGFTEDAQDLPYGLSVFGNIDSYNYESLFVTGFGGGLIFGDYITVSSHDSNLDRKWTKYFGVDDDLSYLIYDVEATSDGGVLICGEVIGAINRGFILKLNKDGDVIVSTNSALDYLSKEAIVYPNPCDEIIIIESDIAFGDVVTINILDWSGNILISNEEYNKDKISCNVASLQGGLYYLELKSRDKQILSTKFIKL